MSKQREIINNHPKPKPDVASFGILLQSVKLYSVSLLNVYKVTVLGEFLDILRTV